MICIISRSIPGFSSVATLDRMEAHGSLFGEHLSFAITDWPATHDRSRLVQIELCTWPGDSGTYQAFTGPDARKDAMRWIEQTIRAA